MISKQVDQLLVWVQLSVVTSVVCGESSCHVQSMIPP